MARPSLVHRVSHLSGLQLYEARFELSFFRRCIVTVFQEMAKIQRPTGYTAITEYLLTNSITDVVQVSGLFLFNKT